MRTDTRSPMLPPVTDHTTPSLPRTSKTVLKACIWCGPVMGLLFVIGFLIAGFFPPPTPGQSAAQVAAMIDEDRSQIRIGIVLCLASCALLMPFQAAITVHMKRIEG